MSPELTTLGNSSVCITKFSDHEMSDDTAERMSKLGPLPSRNAKPVKSAMRTAVNFVARDKLAALESWFLQDKRSYADTCQSYRGLFPGKLDDVLPYSEFEYLPNADPNKIMRIESLINPEERVNEHRLYWDDCLIEEAKARMKGQGTSTAGVGDAGDTQLTHQEEPACQSLARMTAGDESIHDPHSDRLSAMSPMGTVVHERQEKEEQDSDNESLPPGLEEDDGESSDSDGEEASPGYSVAGDQGTSQSCKTSQEIVSIRGEEDCFTLTAQDSEAYNKGGLDVGSDGNFTSIMG